MGAEQPAAEAGAKRPAAGAAGEPTPGGWPLSIESIRRAAARLAGVARRTEVLTSSTLDAVTGAEVHLKAELFQRGGSFKFRGAYNRLSQLSAAERAVGVVAYSSGNHGAAVALAASLLGVPAAVVVPESAVRAKLDAIAGYGATIVCYDPAREEREAIAAALAAERGAVLVPPYEDYEVMAGQGTTGLELAEQAGTLDAVLVPVGGGGLIAGVATALAAVAPGCRVIGVEPAAADDTRRSLAAGERRAVEAPETLADGLRAPIPGERTFAVNRALVAEVVTVEEAEIVAAMGWCFERLKVVVEPSGAVGVAALLSGRLALPARRVGVVLSGGNIDAGRFARLLA